ncbi:sensor domain-containing diguanylate cyclase [Aeromicrobium fastidiosum]|uniref:sensor domain-containing diguanylate cyclase n=1 Tax=Aeromicrobium fastidiosum TaxID=52699 RepID=UPI0020232385|nr:sensor domain-containing diguanylate cyclase [Aeromicrobium fastidiosum]MCL8249815.1 sensor domain-containing diguanylate cyclase [Aeromicrobium fastidiosum]
MSEATSGLQSLAAMAHMLADQHELDDILETAAEQARTALGAATVSISRLNDSGEDVRTLINVGDLGDGEERWPADETYPVSGLSRLTSAIRERRTFVDSIDDEELPEEERYLLERFGKGSSLSTAIVVDGRSWGEFYATRHIGEKVFDDDGVAYTDVLVAILGAAVSRAIREADLQKLAYRDPLTSLLNRRALDEHAARLFDLGDEASREIAIVAMDIDGLKLVNDTEGHPMGDQMIRAVAAALTFMFDRVESSVVARVGGDEFTILVSGDDVGVIEKLVNTLCRDVAEKSNRIGLSAGMASVVLTRDSTSTLTDLFAAADKALYVAKRTQSPIAVLADPLSD